MRGLAGAFPEFTGSLPADSGNFNEGLRQADFLATAAVECRTAHCQNDQATGSRLGDRIKVAEDH